MSKLKISKNPETFENSEDDPEIMDAPEDVEAPTEPDPAPTIEAEEYGKGGTYRSIGGGKRVRI